MCVCAVRAYERVRSPIFRGLTLARSSFGPSARSAGAQTAHTTHTTRIMATTPRSKNACSPAPDPSSAGVTLNSWGYSVKIPFSRHGSKMQNEDADAKAQLLVGIIEELMNDDAHVMPVHCFVQKRIQEQKRQQKADSDAIFDTITTLKGLPDDWVVSWLQKNSDMGLDDLISAKSYDSDAIWQLLFFATQVPLQISMWPELQIKAVMSRFLQMMHEQFGSRISKFKKNGGLGANGKIVWKEGAYSVSFDPTSKRLKKVVHVATGAEVLPEESYIDSSWNLDMN